MAHNPQSCPKCNGEMVRGFVLDVGLGAKSFSQWTRGTPPKGVIWKAEPEDMLPIGTFRCSSCGYLESYAGEEYAPN